MPKLRSGSSPTKSGPQGTEAITAGAPGEPLGLLTVNQMVYLERMSICSWRPCLFVLTAIALSYGSSPAFATDSSSLLSKSEERKIGRKVVAEVRGSFSSWRIPYVAIYLDRMGKRLGGTIGPSTFGVDFHVVADSRVNAFAVPAATSSSPPRPCCFATMRANWPGCAHEMGHVEGRHIAYRMESVTKLNLAAMAAVLAGVFLAKNPQAGAPSHVAMAGPRPRCSSTAEPTRRTRTDGGSDSARRRL